MNSRQLRPLAQKKQSNGQSKQLLKPVVNQNPTKPIDLDQKPTIMKKPSKS